MVSIHLKENSKREIFNSKFKILKKDNVQFFFKPVQENTTWWMEGIHLCLIDLFWFLILIRGSFID